MGCSTVKELPVHDNFIKHSAFINSSRSGEFVHVFGDVRRSFVNSSYWFTIVHSKYLALEQSTGANRLSSAPLL